MLVLVLHDITAFSQPRRFSMVNGFWSCNVVSWIVRLLPPLLMAIIVYIICIVIKIKQPLVIVMAMVVTGQRYPGGQWFAAGNGGISTIQIRD